MVIDIDAHGFPVGELVALFGKGIEGGLVDLFELVAAREPDVSHGTVVEFGEQRADGLIELGPRLNKVRFRRRAMIQRCATKTADSTLALSLGLAVRAGMTTPP